MSFVEKYIMSSDVAANNKKPTVFFSIVCTVCKTVYSYNTICGTEGEICSSCIERAGGGFIKTEVIFFEEVLCFEWVKCFYITYTSLQTRNVLTEKHINSMNTSLVQIAQKHKAVMTEKRGEQLW